MKKIDSIVLSGKETLPLIEGGKGIAISREKVLVRGLKQVVLEHFLELMLILMIKMEI